MHGGEGGDNIVVSMTGSNTPPTILLSEDQHTMDEDGKFSFASRKMLVVVGDDDVSATPGGFLSVAVSGTDVGELEVQTVSTSLFEETWPVWVVKSSADAGGGTLSGTFNLGLVVGGVSCVTGNVHDNSLGKASFENHLSVVGGHGTGESVESLLNALSCIGGENGNGVFVEVSKDGAGAGQVNSDGNDAGAKVAVNGNAEGDGGNGVNGHEWRVTFVNARNDFLSAAGLYVEAGSDAGIASSATNGGVVTYKGVSGGAISGGGFRLGLGPRYVSGVIDFDASGEMFEKAVMEMESVHSVKASRTSGVNGDGGYEWSVTFLSMGEGRNGGDVPELFVAESSLSVVGGSRGVVEVETNNEGVGNVLLYEVRVEALSEHNQIHELRLEGVDIGGSFRLDLGGGLVTGDIWYGTVAGLNEEQIEGGGGVAFNGEQAGQSLEAMLNKLGQQSGSGWSCKVTKEMGFENKVVVTKDYAGVDQFNTLVTPTFRVVKWVIEYLNAPAGGVVVPIIVSDNIGAGEHFLVDVGEVRGKEAAGGTFELFWGESGKTLGEGEWKASGALAIGISGEDMADKINGMIKDDESGSGEVVVGGPFYGVGDLTGGGWYSVAFIHSPRKFVNSKTNSGGLGILVGDGTNLLNSHGMFVTKVARSRFAGESVKFGLETRQLGGVYFPNEAMRGNGENGGSSSIVMRGSVAAVNNALKYLVMTPPSNYVGEIKVHVDVNDGGFSGVGGEMTAHSSFLSVVVEGVDDLGVVMHKGLVLSDDEETL